MNMPHPCLEIQERTIAADNYNKENRTSENNCPVYLRITAVGRMDKVSERFAFMGAEPVFGGRGGEPSDMTKTHRRNNPANKRKLWERTGERAFVEYDSFVACAQAHGNPEQSMRSIKKQAISANPGATFFRYKKVDYWFKDPRESVEGVEVIIFHTKIV
jgi:hypothetical protein